ncbi:MAG: hypothetical protein ACOCXQ_04915 [Patescibacteria group bacterium]
MVADAEGMTPGQIEAPSTSSEAGFGSNVDQQKVPDRYHAFADGIANQMMLENPEDVIIDLAHTGSPETTGTMSFGGPNEGIITGEPGGSTGSEAFRDAADGPFTALHAPSKKSTNSGGDMGKQKKPQRKKIKPDSQPAPTPEEPPGAPAAAESGSTPETSPTPEESPGAPAADESNPTPDTEAEADTNEEEPDTRSEAEKKIDDLNKKKQETLDQYRKGEISHDEADNRLQNDQTERRKVLDNLMDRFEKGDGSKMTRYEREIAQLGLEMQQRMLEIREAPEIAKALEQQMDVMEGELYRFKKKLTRLEQTKITSQNAGEERMQKNVQERIQIGNQISRQATIIARMENHITNVNRLNIRNCNMVRQLNNRLMKKIGHRDLITYGVVELATTAFDQFNRSINEEQVDKRAREIARDGRR